MPSSRASALVEQLRAAADLFIALVEGIGPDQWLRVPGPGAWSPSKDAEHVADGAAYHQWLVRLSLGETLPGRPAIERQRLTAQHPQHQVVALLRQRTDASAALVHNLTDLQLDLPAQPSPTRSWTLANMIADRMIGHYHAHRAAIQSKLR
jgi:hypothetical protein